jgi:hypothetical protein
MSVLIVKSSSTFALVPYTLGVAWCAERSGTTLEPIRALQRARSELEDWGATVEEGFGENELRFSGGAHRKGGPFYMNGEVTAERTDDGIAVTVRANFVPAVVVALIAGALPALAGLPALIGLAALPLVGLDVALTCRRLRGFAEAAVDLNRPVRAV